MRCITRSLKKHARDSDTPLFAARKMTARARDLNLRQEIDTTFFGGDADRICSARKMWITALAIPQKQSQIKPFAGIPSARLKVNSQV